MLLERNPAIKQQLGCPLEPEQGGLSTTTEQPYQNGSMFYFNPNFRIYVFFGKDQGTWRLIESALLGDVPTPTPADPHPCEIPPVRGFGIVWSTYPDIRGALGCPLKPELELFEGAYQPFEHGTMLYSLVGLGRGKSLYVLYENGRFERYDDPNR